MFIVNLICDGDRPLNTPATQAQTPSCLHVVVATIYSVDFKIKLLALLPLVLICWTRSFGMVMCVIKFGTCIMFIVLLSVAMFLIPDIMIIIHHFEILYCNDLCL